MTSHYVVTAVHHVTVNEDRCKSWGIEPDVAITEELGFRRRGLLVTVERGTVTTMRQVEEPGVDARV